MISIIYDGINYEPLVIYRIPVCATELYIHIVVASVVSCSSSHLPNSAAQLISYYKDVSPVVVLQPKSKYTTRMSAIALNDRPIIGRTIFVRYIEDICQAGDDDDVDESWEFRIILT